MASFLQTIPGSRTLLLVTSYWLSVKAKPNQ